MDMTLVRDQRRVRLLALAGGLALAALAAAPVLAAGGVDWQAMLEACQRMMASVGIHVSPEQLRSMLTGCTGR